MFLKYGNKFHIIDDTAYFLEVKNAPRRFLHLVSVGAGALRQFCLIHDLKTKRIYLNEITGGFLEEINDEGLWQDLNSFLTSMGKTGIHNEDQA